ncbi:MAG: SAM-dependent methyltransferase [Planctomycetota bacterium]|jgi:SAM-dependent methyltransferase
MSPAADDHRPPVRLEDLNHDGDGRKYSPSAGRNRQDIVDALAEELAPAGDLLEVAAGTGEHAVLAAERLPGWNWWSTDRDLDALTSLRAWASQARLPNLREPTHLDIQDSWPVEGRCLDVVFASNVLHISPIETAEALFAGAARHLRPGGSLIVYGAFFLPDVDRVESNVQFDQELRASDPRYGVRELSDLTERALARRLLKPTVRAMPNNNFLLRFAIGI